MFFSKKKKETYMMKLYGVPFSVHTRKALLALKVKRIEFDLVPVVPVAPDTLPPNWKEISPTGLIPALQDGDFTLADSTAIILYLDRKKPDPALLPPSDRQFAHAMFLDAWVGGEIFRKVVHPLFFEKVVNPGMRNTPTNQEVVGRVMTADAPAAFSWLDGQLKGDFLVDNRLSIADIAIVSNLTMFHYLGGRIDAGKYPRLAAYFRKHITSPVVAAAIDAEKPFTDQLGLDRSFL